MLLADRSPELGSNELFDPYFRCGCSLADSLLRSADLWVLQMLALQTVTEGQLLAKPVIPTGHESEYLTVPGLS